MEMSSTRSVPADIQTTWNSLNDPEFLKDCISGCQSIERLSNTDGSFFDYSAFSVTNSLLNLAPWNVGTTLTTGRRCERATRIPASLC